MSNSVINRLRRFLKGRDPIESLVRHRKSQDEALADPLALDPAILIEADRLRDEGKLDEAVFILRSLSDQEHSEVARRLGIVLYMKGQVAEAQRLFEKILRRSPEDAVALKFLFGCLNVQGEVDLAIKTARRAVGAAPLDAQLRNALGAMLVDLGAIEEAVIHFQAALDINPSDFGPLVNLEIINSRFGAADLRSITTPQVTQLRTNTIAALSKKFKDGQLALNEADVLCTLTNNHAETFQIAEDIEAGCGALADLPVGLMINFAIVSQNRGDLSQALDYYHRTATLEPGRTDVLNGLGSLYISEGKSRWFDGWRQVSSTYRKLNPRNYPGEVPQWTGQMLSSGRLFIHFDQGFGDALLGLRFVEHLATAGIPVVLWLPLAMADLVEVFRPFAELVVSATRPDPRILGCSFACGLLELIAPMQIPVEEIGANRTLTLPDGLLERWRMRLDGLPGRKIGLATLGNPHRVDDWLRSVPLAQLSMLSNLQDISWINFAVDERPERGVLVDHFDALDLGSELNSFGETAAALRQIDLLITIDCSVAHLAGAVGTPFWLLKPSMLDWRWQIGEQASPWWPEARVFRSLSPGNWGDSARLMASELEAEVF